MRFDVRFNFRLEKVLIFSSKNVDDFKKKKTNRELYGVFIDFLGQ